MDKIKFFFSFFFLVVSFLFSPSAFQERKCLLYLDELNTRTKADALLPAENTNSTWCRNPSRSWAHLSVHVDQPGTLLFSLERTLGGVRPLRGKQIVGE